MPVNPQVSLLPVCRRICTAKTQQARESICRASCDATAPACGCRGAHPGRGHSCAMCFSHGSAVLSWALSARPRLRMLVVHLGKRGGTRAAKAAMTDFPRVQSYGHPTTLSTADSCLSTDSSLLTSGACRVLCAAYGILRRDGARVLTHGGSSPLGAARRQQREREDG